MNDKKVEKSKSPTTKILILIAIAICVVIVIARYVTDEDFRYDIDTNIFKKEVSESILPLLK